MRLITGVGMEIDVTTYSELAAEKNIKYNVLISTVRYIERGDRNVLIKPKISMRDILVLKKYSSISQKLPINKIEMR